MNPHPSSPIRINTNHTRLGTKVSKLIDKVLHGTRNIPNENERLYFRESDYFLETKDSFADNIQLRLTIAEIFVFEAILIKLDNTGI